MKVGQLRTIPRLYFTFQDVARTLSIRLSSAKVFCARAVKSGELLRLKRNCYLLREKWENLGQEEKFRIGNLLQVPSYISLLTALAEYEVTTQVQQAFIESIAVYRSKEVDVEGTLFHYVKIAKPLYFGFVKKENYFIATPEKAFVDCLYLVSLKRYRIDWGSLDLGKLKRKEILRILRRYPAKTQSLWREQWTS